MNLRKATELQIRAHYRLRNMEVRIARDGHVMYRPEAFVRRDDRQWRDGGYVENYHIDERNNVHLI